jgi:ADP-heptose:LPS heptosyltransferase
VSLQKGEGADQWPGPFAGRQVAGQAAVSASLSFLDTAAVLANCDLLISADSAVVHLAGALGFPAWVLLKAIPEWRWGLSGDRSYWYDSLRLFRQSQPGCWQEPLQRVCGELQALAQGQMSPA